MKDAVELEQAYEDLDFQLVECSESLSIPTSNPVRFEYATEPSTADAEEIERRLTETDIQAFDVFSENGSSWYEFNVSATLYDAETNGTCKLKISTAGVTILRKHQDFPFEMFEKVVETVELFLHTRLEYDGGNDERD